MQHFFIQFFNRIVIFRKEIKTYVPLGGWFRGGEFGCMLSHCFLIVMSRAKLTIVI